MVPVSKRLGLELVVDEAVLKGFLGVSWHLRVPHVSERESGLLPIPEHIGGDGFVRLSIRETLGEEAAKSRDLENNVVIDLLRYDLLAHAVHDHIRLGIGTYHTLL